MARIIGYIAATLDGFIAGEGGTMGWPSRNDVMDLSKHASACFMFCVRTIAMERTTEHFPDPALRPVKLHHPILKLLVQLKGSIMKLQGKVALVTGAGSGIGAAIARQFAAEGAAVWVSDIVESSATSVARDIGQRAVALRLDVRDEADWHAAEEAIRAAAGRLDCLVNNAGITGFEAGTASQDVSDVALSDWRAVLATNLEGVLLGCQMAIRMMQAGGAIINIASRSGHVGIPGAAAYAASKAAILNHTRSVALYCAERELDICCNSISPAAILTPMWEPMLGNGPDRENNMAAMVADTPLRRFGQPEEVAALAVLLASDEARYMTGADLTLDGGLLAGAAARPERAE